MGDNDKNDWELFTVTYQLPKFGSNGKEFEDQEWHMMVCTPGGRDDATAACKQHHKGCKVLHTLSQLEVAAGVKLSTKQKDQGLIVRTSKRKGSKK